MAVSEITLPRNIDAERQVLGAILIDGRQEAAERASELLKPNSFFLTSHQAIFTAMLNLFNAQKPLDLIIISEELRREGKLDNAGGVAYLTELTRDCIAGSDVEYHAQLVLEKAMLRHLIMTCEDVRARCLRDNQEDIGELTGILEEAIFRINHKINPCEPQRIGEFVAPAIERLHKIQQGIPLGISTGFHGWDRYTGGVHTQELVTVAAYPKVGKSTFVMNVLLNMARQGVGSLFFSLEMTGMNLAKLALSREGGFNYSQYETGRKPSMDEWKIITDAAGKVSDLPITIYDYSASSIGTITALTKRMVNKDKSIKVIAVDHLQLMPYPKASVEERIAYKENSRLLRALGKDMDLAVIMISQLRRADQSRGGKPKPRISDLRGSGDIEANCDQILMMHRDSYYEDVEDDLMEVTLVSRNSQSGQFKLRRKPYTRDFEEVADIPHQSPPNNSDLTGD